MLDVLVRDLRVAKGTVSGVLVNNTGHELRRLDLLIRYKVGQGNSLSKAKLYTIREQISAGAKVPFTYSSPLPRRSNGLPSIVVASYTL